MSGDIRGDWEVKHQTEARIKSELGAKEKLLVWKKQNQHISQSLQISKKQKLEEKEDW